MVMQLAIFLLLLERAVTNTELGIKNVIQKGFYSQVSGFMVKGHVWSNEPRFTLVRFAHFGEKNGKGMVRNIQRGEILWGKKQNENISAVTSSRRLSATQAPVSTTGLRGRFDVVGLV